MRGSDCDVVQETEPHGALGERVVPRWSRKGDALSLGAREEALDHRQRRPRCELRGRDAVWPEIGVRVEVALPAAERLEPLDEACMMHASELLGGCLAGGDLLPGDGYPRNGAPDRTQPLGSLGMISARNVAVEGRLVD